jgi:hypothetical protein
MAGDWELIINVTFDVHSFCYILLLFCSPLTMAKRPQSAVGNRRPISVYAKVMAATQVNASFRFKVGNNKYPLTLSLPQGFGQKSTF